MQCSLTHSIIFATIKFVYLQCSYFTLEMRKKKRNKMHIDQLSLIVTFRENGILSSFLYILSIFSLLCVPLITIHVSSFHLKLIRLLNVTLALIVTLNVLTVYIRHTITHCVIVVKWRVHSYSRKEESNENLSAEEKKPQSKWREKGKKHKKQLYTNS